MTQKIVANRGVAESNKRRATHGMTGTAEYKAWASMINRCYRMTDRGYHNYGGRGITVCQEWRGPGGFIGFFACLGNRPTPGHTLDRIEVDGNYEPGNVRWSTMKEQGRNRRNNRLLTFRGRTMPLSQWAESIGITKATLVSRLGYLGWTLEQSLTVPAGKPRGPIPLSQLARSAGLSPSLLFSRIGKGKSIDEALSTPPAAARPARILEHDGKAMCMAAWARLLGINQTTIFRRLELGWTVDDALTKTVRPFRGSRK